MTPKLKPIIYGLGVFAVYMIFIYILRFISHRTSNGTDFLGVYSNKDFVIGIAIAVAMTFTHVQKTRIK